MNWLNKDWSVEDAKYAPKRKVNNKQSRYIKHISGYFHSPKMKKKVGYESLWGECLFYYFLELDIQTVRYYDQPIEVPIKVFDEKLKELEEWIHIPDVLVFRNNSIPMLYQVKGIDSNTQSSLITKNCLDYAQKESWGYSIVIPRKELPMVIESNILFLWNFLKQRKNVDLWFEESEQKMLYIQETSIIELAKSFSAKIDYRLILPVIWHMVSIGRFRCDLTKPLDQYSEVRIGNISDQLVDYLVLENKL